jgi:hypothetical protein
LLVDFPALISRASNPDIFFGIFRKCNDFGLVDEFEKRITEYADLGCNLTYLWWSAEIPRVILNHRIKLRKNLSQKKLFSKNLHWIE